MVGEHAVALLRHRPVERAHAGLDVRERHAEAGARQRARERRVGVAVDEHEVGLDLVAATGSSACMIRADLLGVRSPTRPRARRSGARQPQLPEEHRRELVVVVLAAVDQHLLVALAQAPRDGRRLDELRAGSRPA